MTVNFFIQKLLLCKKEAEFLLFGFIHIHIEFPIFWSTFLQLIYKSILLGKRLLPLAILITLLTMVSFSTLQILITLCPIVTILFFEMLAQLVIRLYTKNDIRTGFIRNLLTPRGLVENIFFDKWKKLISHRLNSSQVEESTISSSQLGSSTVKGYSRTTSNSIKNPFKTKAESYNYRLLAYSFTFLTVFLTVFPAVSSYLVSRSTEVNEFSNCVVMEPGKEAYNNRNNLSQGYRIIKKASPHFFGNYSNLIEHSEKRNSTLNIADAMFISNFQTFGIINTTYFDFGNRLWGQKYAPYVIDSMSWYTSLTNNEGLFIESPRIGNIAVTKGINEGNNFITKQFQNISDVTGFNWSLEKDKKIAQTSLFYFENENSGKCLLSFKDEYSLDNSFDFLRVVAEMKKGNFVSYTNETYAKDNFDNILKSIMKNDSRWIGWIESEKDFNEDKDALVDNLTKSVHNLIDKFEVDTNIASSIASNPSLVESSHSTTTSLQVELPSLSNSGNAENPNALSTSVSNNVEGSPISTYSLAQSSPSIPSAFIPAGISTITSVVTSESSVSDVSLVQTQSQQNPNPGNNNGKKKRDFPRNEQTFPSGLFGSKPNEKDIKFAQNTSVDSTKVLQSVILEAGSNFSNSLIYITESLDFASGQAIKTYFLNKVNGKQVAELRCNKKIESMFETNDPDYGQYLKSNDWSKLLNKANLIAYKDEALDFNDIYNSSGIEFFLNNSVEKCRVEKGYKATVLIIWIIATSVVSILIWLGFYFFPLKVSSGDMMREAVSYQCCDSDLARLVTDSKLPATNLMVGTAYNDTTDLNHVGLVEELLNRTERPGKTWQGSTIL